MEKDFYHSYWLVLAKIPAGVVLAAAVIFLIFYLLFGMFILFLLLWVFFSGLFLFVYYSAAKFLGDDNTPTKTRKTLYITDWKGNSILRSGNFFLPFENHYFTAKEFNGQQRTVTEAQDVGITELNLIIKWHPDVKLIKAFMEHEDDKINYILLSDFTKHLHSKYGVYHSYFEKEESCEKIRYESLGVEVTFRSAERVKPVKDEDDEEEAWMQYNGYEIGILEDSPVLLGVEDYAAHIQVIGASRFGKSKLIEHIARQIIYRKKFGLCVLDPNQHLYDDLLTWCIHRKYKGGRIRFLDLSDEKSTVGFNPFKSRGTPTPQKISAQANRLLRTTLKTLGMQSDSAIQAQRIIKCLYYVVIEQNLPITELKAFFTPRLFERRDEIMSRCKSQDIRDQWEMLTTGKRPEAYLSMMQSSANRLFEFISEGRVQQLFTNPFQLDLAEIIEKGEILIVNLNKSDIMPKDARNIIGTFLIDEIWDIMSRRDKAQIEKAPHFNLMIDEFQNFTTPEFAEMLKEGAKYRLHLWLVNHVLSDLDRNVKNALNACHLKMAFGGTMQQDAAFVLEGSYPRVNHSLRDDIELVPRLTRRSFMLRRPGRNNAVCQTPEVSCYPVKDEDKKKYLDGHTRAEKMTFWHFSDPSGKMKIEILEKEGQAKKTKPEEPKPKEPKPKEPKPENVKPEQKKEKDKEIPPDEFYY